MLETWVDERTGEFEDWGQLKTKYFQEMCGHQIFYSYRFPEGLNLQISFSTFQAFRVCITWVYVAALLLYIWFELYLAYVACNSLKFRGWDEIKLDACIGQARVQYRYSLSKWDILQLQFLKKLHYYLIE